MNERLLELAHKRGRLSAKIQAQRAALAQDCWPLVAVLGTADKGAQGLHWLKRHPGTVGAGLLAGLLLRPKRIVRWLRRGYLGWKVYTSLSQRLNDLNRRGRG